MTNHLQLPGVCYVLQSTQLASLTTPDYVPTAPAEQAHTTRWQCEKPTHRERKVPACKKGLVRVGLGSGSLFLSSQQHRMQDSTSIYTGLPGSFRLERCTQDRTAPIAPALCHALGPAFRAAGRRSAGSAGILSTGGAGTGMRASARLSVARKRACCRRRHSLGGAGGRGVPALASLTIGARCSW